MLVAPRTGYSGSAASTSAMAFPRPTGMVLAHPACIGASFAVHIAPFNEIAIELATRRRLHVNFAAEARELATEPHRNAKFRRSSGEKLGFLVEQLGSCYQAANRFSK